MPGRFKGGLVLGLDSGSLGLRAGIPGCTSQPFGGCQFDVVDAPPGSAAVDQLGLGGDVDREGVVITVATRPDRRGDPELSQSVGIGQR